MQCDNKVTQILSEKGNFIIVICRSKTEQRRVYVGESAIKIGPNGLFFPSHFWLDCNWLQLAQFESQLFLWNKPNDCGGIKQSGGIWNLQSDNAGLETELSCDANAHRPPSDKCAYVQMHDVQFDKYAKHLSRTHLHLHSGPKTCF